LKEENKLGYNILWWCNQISKFHAIKTLCDWPYVANRNGFFKIVVFRVKTIEAPSFKVQQAAQR